MIRVIICEDNQNLRQSLGMLIDGLPGYEVAATFENCADIEIACMQYMPDVVLLDIDMPVVNGLEGLKRIREVNAQLPVIMLTVFDDNKHLFEAIRSGATGYLLKDTAPSKIFDAITDAIAGGAPMTPSMARKVLDLFSGRSQVQLPNGYELTPRENEILKLLVEGNSYKMIAAELMLTLETVKTHLKNIYAKLQVHSQTEAVGKALKEKLV